MENCEEVRFFCLLMEKTFILLLKIRLGKHITLPILTVSRILSLGCPYTLMAGNRDLRLDVALQHSLSGMFLLSLLHINCPDTAPLQVFRKCLSSNALHRVVRLAAAFMKFYSEFTVNVL